MVLETLTKAGLADHIADVIGLNKREATDIIEQIIEKISTTLANGEMVKISGFGKFKLRDKKERPGRNPKTGESVPVDARRVVTFKASQRLKELVEQFEGSTGEKTE
ncbi:MAG: integration host factor subunit alpha [Gammaproteobacteria bacterium]|jgi:integration host factor subunit alpha